MFERFTDRARRVVVLAQEEARMLNHNYIGTEHVYETLGFTVEGRRRHAVLHRGEFHDQLWMGMLDTEYQEQYGRG